ncbi:hypothetical protein AJ79_09180 [Helicocarpus griseus UAMH5409]|uniref:F-box domain-containing protein n=1 Tax=Helicocarpus griseus UAMH5409 TaxID=1447875 RepID=A0A2B7WLV7_9EURO|nr:hypothetical protein AJ79_09180 [Helicocarpus griseus UAMH5409]
MATLDKLPLEIMLKIFSLLSYKDTVALSLQCRRLHTVSDLARRRRYRRIRVDGQYWPRAYNLLWKILKKPALGLLVEEIVSDTNRFLYGDWWFPRPGKEDEPLLNSAITKAGFDDLMAEDLLKILMVDQERVKLTLEPVPDGFQEALTAMLLVVCPNVRTLRMPNVNVKFIEELLKMARSSGSDGNQCCLQNLRYVDLLRDTSGVWYSLELYTNCGLLWDLKPIMRVPSIESVTVRGVCEDGQSIPFLAPGISNIKEIDIRYSSLQRREFWSIMRHPRGLESFKFSSGQLRDLTGDVRYHPKIFGKALLRHRSTLKVLDLDVDLVVTSWSGADYDSEDEDEDEDYDEETNDSEDSENEAGGEDYENGDDGDEGSSSDHDSATSEQRSTPSVSSRVSEDFENSRPYGETIGSLHDFVALKRLSIGVRALFGPGDQDDPEIVPFRLINSLPPNLEYLCIRGYVAGQNPSYTSQIEEFMENKDRWPASLKEVCGIGECIDGLPALKGPRNDEGTDGDEDSGDEDGEEEEEEVLPWEKGKDNWTDYNDEAPPNLQEVPWVKDE